MRKPKTDLFVDKFNLDDAAAEQPEMYMECVKLIEAAKSDVDDLEQDLEEHTSVLDLNIRSEPELYGIVGDIKERAVKSSISQDATIKDLRKDLAKAKRELKRLEGRKEALDQRKQMVRLLGDLWLGEYYSDIEVREAKTRRVRKTAGRRHSNE